MTLKKSHTDKPKKHLGQHFLRDEGFLEYIVGALSPSAGEVTVEIGAGKGALTTKLLEAGFRVHALEIDRDLITRLQKRFAGNENFTLVHGDARTIDYSAFGKAFKVAGNLPYQSATVITTRLMEYLEHIPVMVLTFQKEVAERITALPGSRSYGYFSCLVQYHCLAEYLITIPPGAFRPAPKVQSGVVRLRPRPDRDRLTSEEKSRLFQLVKSAFSHRRKTFLNALVNSEYVRTERERLREILIMEEIDPGRRPETFSLDEFIKISRIIPPDREGAGLTDKTKRNGR